MEKHRYWPAVAVAAAVVVLLQALIGLLSYWLLPDWPTRGQFGDVFGAANALFSGLAFAGLIYAVLLQRQELSLQREELKLTREQLQRSAKAQEESEVALRTQADAAGRATRLDTATVLLEHYRSERQKRSSITVPGDDKLMAEVRELTRREAALLAILDAVYGDIAGERR